MISAELAQWNALLGCAFRKTDNRSDGKARVLSFSQAARVRSLPQRQLPLVGGRGTALGAGAQWRARDALTARGEEAHLPQEEGGVHVVQGLLHILKAAAARPGRENKPEDKPYNSEPRSPCSSFHRGQRMRGG